MSAFLPLQCHPISHWYDGTFDLFLASLVVVIYMHVYVFSSYFWGNQMALKRKEL